MKVAISLLLFTSLLVVIAECKPPGSKGRFSSFGKRSRPSYIGSRSRGLSMSRKSALLGSAAGLAGAYIGFKLASHDRLNSHYNTGRYTVCEGPRQELNEYGVMTTYQYTVCPMSAPYCCRSYDYVGERCCPGEMRVFKPAYTMGSVFGSLLMIGLFCALLYFCCFRRRRVNQRSTMHAPATIMVPMDHDPPLLPVPTSKPTISDPPPPYPTTPNVPEPYAPPPYAPPAIGSAWNSPPSAPENPGLPYPPPAASAAPKTNIGSGSVPENPGLPYPPPASATPNTNVGSGWNAPAPPYPPN